MLNPEALAGIAVELPAEKNCTERKAEGTLPKPPPVPHDEGGVGAAAPRAVA
jgi:hypothetical protein